MIDQRLVAGVQCAAGAHVHEAANLISYYYLSLQLRYCDFGRSTPVTLRGGELDDHIVNAEVSLRRFAYQVRSPRQAVV